MASNLIAMASNLVAMGLQSNSGGLQPNSDGLQDSNSIAMASNLVAMASNLMAMVNITYDQLCLQAIYRPIITDWYVMRKRSDKKLLPSSDRNEPLQLIIDVISYFHSISKKRWDCYNALLEHAQWKVSALWKPSSDEQKLHKTRTLALQNCLLWPRRVDQTPSTTRGAKLETAKNGCWLLQSTSNSGCVFVFCHL